MIFVMTFPTSKTLKNHENPAKFLSSNTFWSDIKPKTSSNLAIICPDNLGIDQLWSLCPLDILTSQMNRVAPGHRWFAKNPQAKSSLLKDFCAPDLFSVSRYNLFPSKMTKFASFLKASLVICIYIILSLFVSCGRPFFPSIRASYPRLPSLEKKLTALCF